MRGQHFQTGEDKHDPADAQVVTVGACSFYPEASDVHAHCCPYPSLSQAPPPGSATLPMCMLLDQAGKPGYSLFLSVDSLLLVHPQRKTTYVHCLYLFIPLPDTTAAPSGCSEKDNLKQRTKLFFSPAPMRQMQWLPSLSPPYSL